MYKIGDKVIVKDKTYQQESAKKYIGQIGEIVDMYNDHIFIKGFKDKSDYLIEWDIDDVFHISKEVILHIADGGEVMLSVNGTLLKNDDLQHYTVLDLASFIMDYPLIDANTYKIEFCQALHQYVVQLSGLWRKDQDQLEEFNTGCLFADKEKAQQVADKFNNILREGM